MAIQIIGRAVIRQVTQRVLAGVLDQLPERLSQHERPIPTTVSGDVALVDEALFGALQADVQRSRIEIEQLRTRLAVVESRTGWRTYVRLGLLVLLGYALGFSTQVIILALGWI